MDAIILHKIATPTLEKMISLADFDQARGHFRGGPHVKALREASSKPLARSGRCS